MSGKFFKDALISDCVSKLAVIFDREAIPNDRVAAFKELRFNSIFKEIALGFLLDSIPREKWPDIFSFSVSANFMSSDGKTVSKVVQAGALPNRERTDQIREAKEAAAGEGKKTPQELLERVRRKCDNLLNDRHAS